MIEARFWSTDGDKANPNDYAVYVFKYLDGNIPKSTSCLSGDTWSKTAATEEAFYT